MAVFGSISFSAGVAFVSAVRFDNEKESKVEQPPPIPVPANSVGMRMERVDLGMQIVEMQDHQTFSNVPVENPISSTLATQGNCGMSSKAEFSNALAERHRLPCDSMCVDDLHADKGSVDIILNYGSKAALVTDKYVDYR